MKQLSEKQRGPVGARLVALRDRAGLSQEEAAKKIGVAQATLSTWETNRNVRPDTDNLARAAKVYKSTVQYIRTGDDTPPEQIADVLTELRREIRTLNDRLDQALSRNGDSPG